MRLCLKKLPKLYIAAPLWATSIKNYPRDSNIYCPRIATKGVWRHCSVQ